MLLRMHCVLKPVICLLHFIFAAATHIHGPAEYCQSEVFRATCRKNEVIVMTSATYGRMRTGRCVASDLGYLGCSSDVLPVLHAACSGHTECNYPVPSPALDNTKPCFRELKTYLEVAYRCVKVAMADKSVCHSSPYLKLLSDQGYLSSHVASHYGCGTLASPWRILISSGQRVNTTVIHYTCNASDNNSNNDRDSNKSNGKNNNNNGYNNNNDVVRYSSPLGFISNARKGVNMSIPSGCAASGQHLSFEHSIDIQLVSDRVDGQAFLLKYEVSGCQDLVAPRFAWYSRKGEHATVGCLHGETTWHLMCEGNTWKGVIGNCRQAASSIGSEPSRQSLPTVSTIIIILCLALGIAFVVLLSGFCFVIRKQKKEKPIYSTQHPSSSTKQHVVVSYPTKYGHNTRSELAGDYATDLGYHGRFEFGLGLAESGHVTSGLAESSHVTNGLTESGHVTSGDSDYCSQSYISNVGGSVVAPPNNSSA